MADPDPSNHLIIFEGGAQPVDQAWMETVTIPVAVYNQRATELDAETIDDTEVTGAVLTYEALRPEWADLVVDAKADELAPIASFTQKLQRQLVRSGMPEHEASHIVRVFSLGIILGQQTAQITDRYVDQGLRQLQAGTEE